MRQNQYLEQFNTIPSIVMEAADQGHTQTPPSRKARKEIVERIWMEQPWGAHPVLDIKGRKLEILSPGWLNGGDGPNFKGALFRHDGGDQETGDVAIHVRSSDWARHKHHRDMAYNETRLHVVLYCDAMCEPRITSMGGTVIEVELATVCASAIDRIRATAEMEPSNKVPQELAGRCSSAMARIGGERGGNLLDAAGETRLELKSRRYFTAIKKGEGEEELYCGLLEALGYKAFKNHFERLAISATLGNIRLYLEDIRRSMRPIALQGLLLGTANLIPNPILVAKKVDKETAVHLGLLWEAWNSAQDSEMFRPALTANEWKVPGTRPANFPSRRIAGLAHFLAVHADSNLHTLFINLLNAFPADGDRKKVNEWFDGALNLFPHPEDDYWARRYSMGGERLKKPLRFIGRERLTLILVNVLLPYAMACAQTGDITLSKSRIMNIYKFSPSPEPNSVVKFMVGRFKNAMPQKELVQNPVRQYGLMQIYSDFCAVDSDECQSCGFATYLEKLGSH